MGVAENLANIGIVLANEGKYAEAMEKHKESLAIQEKLVGKEHLSVAANLANIGIVLCDQGRYAESMERHAESLSIQERSVGRDHMGVAENLSSVGRVLSFQGKYDEALERYEESLAIQTRLVGREHTGSLIAICCIGDVKFMQGRYGDSLRMYAEAESWQRRLCDQAGAFSVVLQRFSLSLEAMERQLHQDTAASPGVKCTGKESRLDKASERAKGKQLEERRGLNSKEHSELEVFQECAPHASNDSMRLQRGRCTGRMCTPDMSMLWQTWSLSYGQAVRAAVSRHMARCGTLESSLLSGIMHSHLPNVSHRDPKTESRVNLSPNRFINARPQTFFRLLPTHILAQSIQYLSVRILFFFEASVWTVGTPFNIRLLCSAIKIKAGDRSTQYQCRGACTGREAFTAESHCGDCQSDSQTE
eukprot:2163700-Rhodomonas_salina.4